MQYTSMSIDQVHILRVDPGEDLLASIERFVRETHLEQAVVLGGYGTLAAYHIHWVVDNQLPSHSTYGRGEGGIEILAMNGLVVGGAPHIHITLSTQQGAFGGHLEPGCIAYVLCEVFFASVGGVTLARERVGVTVEGLGEGEISRLVFGE